MMFTTAAISSIRWPSTQDGRLRNTAGEESSASETHGPESVVCTEVPSELPAKLQSVPDFEKALSSRVTSALVSCGAPVPTPSREREGPETTTLISVRLG